MTHVEEGVQILDILIRDLPEKLKVIRNEAVIHVTSGGRAFLE